MIHFFCAFKTTWKIVIEKEEAGEICTYHGVPRRISDCTDISQAKMPIQIAEADKTMRIQMLSWSSGQ